MKIGELFGKRMTFSFEVFPPKADQPVAPLLETLSHLYAYKPDFISCTYGAGGTNKGRQAEILREIRESGVTEPLAHFTCVGNTREDINATMGEYHALGISNALALRGDLPANWEGTRGDFQHADELMKYLNACHSSLDLAGACYPEKHIAAVSMEDDIRHLRTKQDNGAKFLMSQLCYDVDAYRRFIERIRKAGVTIPVVVGVMPVLNRDATLRMALQNGCAIPAELSAIIGKYGGDPAAFKSAGKAYSVELIRRYLAAGIEGLHIYTLNRYQDVSDIVDASGVLGAKPIQ